MTCSTSTPSKRHVPARLAVGLAISVILGLGAFVAPAKADGPYDNRSWNERGDQYYWDHRGDHRDWDHRDWDGRYYRTPPVIYGSPYYDPPPVIYGPGFGLNVPGLSIHVH